MALAIGVARFALTPVAPLMLASGALPGIGSLARMAMANYLGNLAGTVLCITVIPRHAQLRALRVAAVAIVGETHAPGVDHGHFRQTVARARVVRSSVMRVGMI